MTTDVPSSPATAPRIFWHRDLPPLDATPVSDDVIEADSASVPYRWDERDALWGHVYPALRASVEARLLVELERANGRLAHIVDEEIRPVIDHAAGTYRLHGRFAWVLYR